MEATLNYYYVSIYAIIPVALVMFYVYKKDKFPEPPRVVFITIFLGISTIFPSSLLIPIVEEVGNNYHNTLTAENFYQSFFRAAFLEETLKFLVITLYCLHLDEFDEPMDAVVYGVAASLGFAVYENWEYVVSALNKDGYDHAVLVAVIRAISAVLLHALAGVMMGFFLIDAVFGKENHKLNMVLALLFPVCLHGFYNYILFTDDISSWWAYALIIIFLIRARFIFKNLQESKIKKHKKRMPQSSEIVFSILSTFGCVIFFYTIINI